MATGVRVLGRIARDPALRRIQVGYLGFAIAEHGTWLAGILYAYDRGGVGDAGLVAVVLLLPGIGVAPIAAFAADRFPGGRVLAVGYGVQASAMLATALAIAADATAIVVYAAAMVAATAVTLTRPAIGVVLPNATHTPADLTAANVMLGLAEHTGMFVGPAMAGLLAGASGVAAPFVAGAMLTGFAAVTSLRLPVGTGATIVDDGARSALGDVVAGLRALRSDRPVRLMVGMLAFGSIVVGAADVLFVATADHVADGDTSMAGLFGTAAGLGALVGSVLTVVLVGRPRLTPFIATGVGVLGLSLGVLARVTAVGVAAAVYALMGAGESVLRVSASTMIQRVAPPAVVGRYFGIAEGLHMFGLAIGSGAIGLLVAWLGYSTGLLLAGIAVPVLLLFRLPPLLRVDRDAVAPDERVLELLLGDDIFEALPAPVIERLAADASHRRVASGAIAIRAGDAGDHYYIVDSGSLRLTAGDAELADLGPGDGFGELALLHDAPRRATATALSEVELLAIERENFLQAVTGHPHSRAVGRERTDRYLGSAGQA